MDSLSIRVSIKSQYDFYYYLSSLRNEHEWKTFYENLVILPDVAEELEELKKETKRRLENEQNTEEYVENITGFVLNMSFLSSPILEKIVHYMSNEYFSYYTPRYIKDLDSYSYVVEEIRLIKYRIQLFLFLKFIQEFSQQVIEETPVLNSILSATDLCLMESKNKEFWEPAFNKYIETVVPLLTDLKQNHSHEYDEFHKFFELKCVF